MPSDKDQRSILRIVPDTSQHLPGEVLETPAGREQSESVCQLCFGTGMEIVPGKGARRCSCRNQDRRTSLLSSARIPPRYEHCVLSNYQAESHEDSKWRAKQQADVLYEDYPAIAAAGRGLLFMGPVGVGKTH